MLVVAGVQVRVLGPLEVQGAGGPVALAGAAQRAVLALLALRAGRPVAVAELVDALWPEDPPASARNSLQSHVARVRARLGVPGLITLEPAGYRLHVAREQVDALRFEDLLRVGSGGASSSAPAAVLPGSGVLASASLPASVEGSFRSAAATSSSSAAAQAVALWRGAPLPEFPGEPFRGVAARLVTLYHSALVRLAGTRDAAEAAVVLREAADADPCWEEGSVVLAGALARAGSRGDALEVLRRHADAVVERLGLDPSDQVREAQVALLRGGAPAVSVAAGSPPTFAGSSVGYAGGPEPAVGSAASIPAQRGPTGSQAGSPGYRLGSPNGTVSRDHPVRAEAGGRPGTSSAAAPDAPRDRAMRVPLRFSSFVGREGEQRQLAALLAEPGLVSVVGPGGVGKTRLVAETVRAAPDVAWVDAAEVGDADFLGAVAVAVGARVALSSAVGEIVERLDLLPLAIELAATQAAALGVEELHARLDDRLDLLSRGQRGAGYRHRTLRAVVEWSFGLLDVPSARLLRRLAVFAGGFTVAAAEAVAADDMLPRPRVAALLAGLVDRSLVARHGPGRFRLLETVRAYATEQLETVRAYPPDQVETARTEAVGQRGNSRARQQGTVRGYPAGRRGAAMAAPAERPDNDRAATEARHAAAMAAAAEELDSRMRGPGQAAAVREIDLLLPDLRAAYARGSVETRVRLAAAMYRYGYRCQQYEVLAWGRAAIDGPAHPDALAAAATHAWGRGDLEEARKLAGRADPPSAAAHEVLGDVALVLCDAPTAVRHYQAMTGDPAARVSGLAGEALVRAWSGQVAEAVELGRAAVELADSTGNPGARAEARYALGEALGDTDPPRALNLLDEATALAASVDDRLFQAAAGTAAVAVRSRHGDPGPALAAFRDVLRLWQRAGNDTLQAAALRNLIVLLVRVGADDTAVLIDAALPPARVYPAEAARLDRARAAAGERLGPEVVAALRRRGALLGAAQLTGEAARAIDAALARQRG